jgi:tRNA(fMet)-specific endonuclease VapC
MIIMLASDICRTVIRDQPAPLLSQLQQWSAASAEIVISSITYAELVAAALLTSEQERHMRLVEEFCARLDAIVSWDSAAVDAYTTLQRSLMREQRVLNMNDVMIAAHAISLDGTLLSSNERAFSGLAELNLQLWNEAEK